MRQDKFSKAHLILYACGIIPVVWLALLLAPYMGGGLAGLVRYGGRWTIRFTLYGVRAV